MGMSTGGGGLDQEPGVQTVLSEINVTPFVDVMLVLLIIFRVTAPLMTQGIEVNLPQVQTTNLEQLDEEPVVLTVTADNQCQVRNSDGFPCEQLEEKLPLIYANRQDKSSLFIRGDVDTPYGALMEVLAAARQVGIISVGLVTEPPGAREEVE